MFCAGRDWSSAGPKFLGRLLKQKGDGEEYIEWEDRTTARQEKTKEKQEKEKQRHSKGLRLENGEIRIATPEDEETPSQSWGAYKAVELLHFTAKVGPSFGQRPPCFSSIWRTFSCDQAFAQANLCEKEAIADFFDALLDVFWSEPSKGNRGPTTEELRRAERAALEKAFRLKVRPLP